MFGCAKKAVTGTLLLLVGIYPFTVHGQPFGLGSSRSGEQPQHRTLSSPNGRFVFGQISGLSKDQFMLDTATGRLWRIGESGKLGTYLKPIPYRNEEGKCTALPRGAPDHPSGGSGEKR